MDAPVSSLHISSEPWALQNWGSLTAHTCAGLRTHNIKHVKRERWGAGVETQKNVRGEIGGWGRVPFNETYAPSLSTIYDGA